MKDPNNPCLFCNINKKDIEEENNLSYASYDSYPVSKNHCLIIPKRHVSEYFDLTKEEIIACNDLISIMKHKIMSEDKSVKGFNIGVNSFKPISYMCTLVPLLPASITTIERIMMYRCIDDLGCIDVLMI